MDRHLLNVEFINELSRLNEYDWSVEYKIEELQQSFSKYYDKLEIDFDNLTKDEAISLGFKLWKDNIMLIPLYLKPKLPIGIELVDIFDDIVKYDGNNIDNDIRFGCLAYGIRINK